MRTSNFIQNIETKSYVVENRNILHTIDFDNTKIDTDQNHRIQQII